MMSKPEHWTLAKFLKGEASASEKREVSNWINASVENKKEFDQVKLIWDSYEEKGSTFEPDLSKAWDKIESGMETTSNFQISPWFYRVAAILVLGIGIGYLTFDQAEPGQEQVAAMELSEFKALNGVEDFVLPDGSVVTLNNGASIFYKNDFGSNDRQVELKGEAFFDVKRDEDRPFIIKTANTTTQVLGTSFSISPIGEDVEVTVVSGKVSFRRTGDNDNVLLTKGEKGRYDHVNKTVGESLNEDLNFLSWKTGKLSFEDAPINQVVHDLERHYEATIQLENHDISRLTASFDNQALSQVLEIVAATLDIEIEELTASNYIIRK